MYKYLADTDIRMYDIFNFISILALLVMNMAQLKKKSVFLSNSAEKFIRKHSSGEKKSIFSNRLFIAFIEMFMISLVQYGFVSILTTILGNWLETGKNYFGVLFVVPFILMAFFYIIGIAPLKQLDMITPAYAIALVFVKIACFCCGCCNGIEYEGGLYNKTTELTEFPVQLIEAGLGLIIFIFILIYRKKAKEGTLLPIYIVLYSATRFFSEFLRHEENILWILKTYHILCIAGVILGVIELWAVLKYGDRITKFYIEKEKRKKRIRF